MIQPYALYGFGGICHFDESLRYFCIILWGAQTILAASWKWRHKQLYPLWHLLLVGEELTLFGFLLSVFLRSTSSMRCYRRFDDTAIACTVVTFINFGIRLHALFCWCFSKVSKFFSEIVEEVDEEDMELESEDDAETASTASSITSQDDRRRFLRRRFRTGNYWLIRLIIGSRRIRGRRRRRRSSTSDLPPPYEPPPPYCENYL